MMVGQDYQSALQLSDVSAPSRFHDLVLKVIPYVLLPKYGEYDNR